MVDGNFPASWDRQPSFIRFIITSFIYKSRATLGTQSAGWNAYFQRLFPRLVCTIVGATASSEFIEATPRSDSSASSVILYVRWVTKENGVRDLLHAFSKLRLRYPNIKLRLVGPLFDHLHSWEQYASSLGIQANVEFVGPISNRHQLIIELQHSTVFVLPSHAEGLPVVLLEAMSLGLPCIASNVAAISDLFDGGNAGVLIPPHRPEQLALAIDDLLGDPYRRPSLSDNALHRARNEYSQSEFIRSYLKILAL